METKKASLIIAFIFLINIVSALSPPLLPDHFKGNLLIDNNNAPIGTEIKIYVNSQLENTITTTVFGKYDLYVKTGNYGDEIKFKVNSLETSAYSRTGGETFNENLQVWTDRDKDGIADNSDKLIGNKSNVDNNFNNLSIAINNNEILNGIFSGTKTIKFTNDNKEILSFDFNFDSSILNLFNIEVKKQTGTEGSIIIKGMPSGIVKTAYIDILKTSTNAVCIKDEEISAITEISTNCDNSSSETKINCPGSSGSYTCSIEGSRFKISGLSHSGVKEFYIASPASPPASGGSSGGGSSGGGGGGGGGGSSAIIPATTTSSTDTLSSATENKNESNATKNETLITNPGITGAVIGFVKTTRGIISLTFIGVIFIVGIYVLSRKKIKKNKF